MIRSMTGFGAARGASGAEELDVEIRSVNHKFSEVKVRAPRELGALEIEVARMVKERLARGGVDVAIRRPGGSSGLAPRIDVALAESYSRAFREMQVRLGLPGTLTLADVIGADGVVRLEERSVDLDAAREALRRALGTALDRLVEMRVREGEALARDLAGRLEVLETSVARIELLGPPAIEHHRARLAERVQELARGVAVDPGRLEQEVVLLADRTDVTEEITRLRSHVAQVRALLKVAEPAGRKLDFLVQEMHREMNTIGSKSQSAEIAALVVALKAEVERMREQVQNVE
ncbi:MAG TPA: YicC/YloC family endoribonuclease [Anaeromyxobacter sp.]